MLYIMTDDMHVSDSSNGHDWPRVRLPLNSKRLTAEQIKRVGRVLEVPTNAAVNEVRVMIEGKLRGMDRDPTSVQVVIGATGMSLWGEDGEFLSIVALPPTDTPPEGEEQNLEEHEEHSDGKDSGHEIVQLRTDLQEAKFEIQTLRETISSLQTQVDQGKACIKQTWRDNCTGNSFDSHNC